MADPQLKLKRWFRDKTEPHGIKTQLAKASRFTSTQISRMRNIDTDDPKKRQEIPLEMIEAAARFFNELPPGFEDMVGWLDTRPGAVEVPLVGYVGAGAEAHFYAESQGPFDMVPAPDGVTPSTVAVEIHGGSLGELFDHWIVFYDDVRSPVTPDLIGRLCIVGLEDDRILIKKIKASKTKGLYHLLSNMEEPILDASVRWAAKVKSMVPR